MNSIENLLIAPLKSFDRENFSNYLNSLSIDERKKLISGICSNKFSSIYLKYIYSAKINDLFNKDELSILKNHSDRFQIQNLEIVKTDSDNGFIFVKGSIPGSKGGWVILNDAKKIPLREDLPLPAGIKGHDVNEEAPAEEAPVEEAPTEEAPTEEAPTEEAPVEEAPTEEAPADDEVKDES